MKANNKFLNLPKHFWAHVKLLSEDLGYSDRGTGNLRFYTNEEILESLEQKSFRTTYLKSSLYGGKTYLQQLLDYLNYRSEIITKTVEPNLMNRDQAAKIFNHLKTKINPRCKLPMNKQKGKKRHYAYMTGIVNMLTEQTLEGMHFDEDPYSLTVATKNDRPVRTFTRRFDGAYPKTINPKALWEIKEYYGTTTFGSRVADGIYESILDGEEIQELFQNEGIKIFHYLIVDDHFTWWVKGKSYICRIIDMLHMGYIDECLFGKEVVKQWPIIVKSWKKLPSQ
ncbi:MAG: hypothetical protein JXI43_10325 [Tissierellales bacterium]|nr:hypothetical protein [Tissierellales bacterium]